MIEYAGRAVQIADTLNGGGLEAGFVERLALAPSNLPRFGNGAAIYDQLVRPAAVDLAMVAAHYAMSTLFEESPPEFVYSFDTSSQSFARHETGRARLGLGRVSLRSRITHDEGMFTYGVLHLGDHNLDGGVRPFMGDEEFDSMTAEITAAFERADYPQTIRLIDHHFGDHAYSLGSLFRDEQRNITNVILDGTLADAESVYRHLYEDNAPLMRYLDSVSIPLPRVLRTAAEFIMNVDVSRALGDDPIDFEYIENYFHETSTWGLELDVPGISFAMEAALERLANRLSIDASGPEEFDEITNLIELIRGLPFGCDYWTAQNHYYALLTSCYQKMRRRAEYGDAPAAAWVTSFERLGNELSVHVA